MAIHSPADLANRMGKMGKALAPDQIRKDLLAIVPVLRRDATGPASADLGGDRKFSGWPGPDALDISAHLHRDGKGMTIGRSPGSGGPWRVAELGRNRGNAAGFAGPGIGRSTGLTSRTKKGNLRKVRAVKAKRWTGYTSPKHTWSKGAAAMGRDARKLLPRRRAKAVFEAFKGG